MHEYSYQRAKLCVLFARIVGVAAFAKGNLQLVLPVIQPR